MQRSFYGMALVLGLLSAVGPFAIDMYLPALPTIGAALHATAGQVQATLMAFMLALGMGQVVYGPLSDMWGRKPPLYAGLTLFAIGSVGCALAPTLPALVAWRFVQGMGASAGMVIPRAVVRDLHTGPEAARLMALLMLVFSVSPILAPLAGTFLIEAAGWRAVFWCVAAAALAAGVLMFTRLPETRSTQARVGSDIASAFRAYRQLLGDRQFVALSFIGGFGVASFFAYLANSSFVLIDGYGLSPREYSLVFAVNAASFFGVSQMTGRLGQRFGLRRVARVAVTIFAIAMLCALALQLAGVTALLPMLALLFVGYGMLGLVMPATMVLSMDAHGPIAGAASALAGTLHFVVGILVMALVSSQAQGSALPMLAGIAGSATLACLIAQLTLRRGDTPPAEAADASRRTL